MKRYLQKMLKAVKKYLFIFLLVFSKPNTINEKKDYKMNENEVDLLKLIESIFIISDDDLVFKLSDKLDSLKLDENTK